MNGRFVERSRHKITLQKEVRKELCAMVGCDWDLKWKSIRSDRTSYHKQHDLSLFQESESFSFKSQRTPLEPLGTAQWGPEGKDLQSPGIKCLILTSFQICGQASYL